MKFTVEAIKKIKATDARQEIADTECPGLYLIVQTTGAKSYVTRYRFNGERRKKALGPADEKLLALANAREKVRAIRRELIEGRDPEAVAIVATEDSEAIKKSLIGAIWPEYVAEQLSQVKESSKKRFKSLFETHILPTWKDRRIQTITRRDVIEMVKAAKPRGPYAGNATVTVLSSFFNWALASALIDVSPVMGVKKPISEKDNERSRTLNDEEIKIFWNACRKLKTVRLQNVFGPMFRMLLITGQRRNEVAEMEWREIDLIKREWLLPASRSKNGIDNLIYLNDAALEILKAMPRIEGSKYIFSTTGKSPVSGFSKAKIELDKLAPISEGWRLHDLRRTFRTNLSRLKMNSAVGEACLNHTMKGVGRVYDRYDFWTEKRTAWTRWGGLLARIVTGDAKAVATYVKSYEPAEPVEPSESSNVLAFSA